MKDEIKEIDITKDFYLCSPLLNTECMKENCYINNGPCYHTVNKEHSQQHLLDYITNLQTIEQQYSAILSENAELENKITNLQEETKRQSKAQVILDNQIAEMLKYKQRNEKAIEYINKSEYATIESYKHIHADNEGKVYNLDVLLKILKGE